MQGYFPFMSTELFFLFIKYYMRKLPFYGVHLKTIPFCVLSSEKGGNCESRIYNCLESGGHFFLTFFPPSSSDFFLTPSQPLQLIIMTQTETDMGITCWMTSLLRNIL